MKFLKWLDDHFEEILMMLALWGIVGVMFAQVIMRYVFKNSLSFAEELSRYFFIWMAFLGISYAVKGNSHIRIDILETIFPVLKKPLEIIGDVVLLAFCVYMLQPSYNIITKLISTNQTSPAMEAPMWIVYLSLLVGFCLTIFRIVQKYILKVMSKKSKGGEEA